MPLLASSYDSPDNMASLILGNQNSNIPRIIEIFAEAFSVEALPPSNEVYGRMVNITRQVQVKFVLFFLEARAEILTIISLLFWKI